VKIIFNYRDQTQRCNCRLVHDESQLRATTTTDYSLYLLRQLATSLELCRKEGIMVCKPINQINFKLEEMFDAIVWVFMTVRQASVFDANNF